MPREFETIDYTFEFVMDYGALREFNRHRMMTLILKPLTTSLGTRIPALIEEATLQREFESATATADRLRRELAKHHGIHVAQYAVTHAHLQASTAKMNLRQLDHVISLRTSPNAHESISGPVAQAAKLAANVHPELFQAIAISSR